MRKYLVLLTAITCVLWSAGASADADALAKHLLSQFDSTKGVCVVLGGDEVMVSALVDNSGFLVHCLEPDKQKVADMRKALDAVYGTRVIVEKSDLSSLPHAANTVDLVLSATLDRHTARNLNAEEILRALRPGGMALIGGEHAKSRALEKWTGGDVPDVKIDEDTYGAWACFEKPEPAGTDDWPMWQHGVDNNPASTDQVIRAPYMTQWLGEPYYIAMPSITTTAGGRTFLAMGHIAHHPREEPWLNTLVARNGYNGAELWRRKLPEGYVAHRSAFVATDDVFYMIADDGQGCLLLDPETGEQLGEIRIPGVEGEWKWIALDNGVLYVLAGGKPDNAETTRVRSHGSHWGWQSLSKGYYEKRLPYGFGRTLAAYDVAAKKPLWTHTENETIDSRAMVMNDVAVFFYGPETGAGAISRTGETLWKTTDPKITELIEQEGRALASTPGFRTMCYSLYADGVLFYAAQTRQNVVAISAEDGSYLWHRKKTTNNANLLYADGKLIVGVGPLGEENTLALDPKTGETVENLGFMKTNCVRMTATPDSFFCRGGTGPSGDGTLRYDRATKMTVSNGAVRPACNDGALASNGLLYVGPWLCDCNLQLMGTVTLCSAEDIRPSTAPALAKTGNVEKVEALEVTAKDWPMYRANADRSSSTTVGVPESISKRWSFVSSNGSVPTAPVAAGGLVFLGSSDGKVRAMDAATGEPRWVFYTGSAVIAPPTIWNGRAYFGSGDGYIYAVEAATGKEVWQFRAAPAERRIMSYGALRSTWPVNTGVLVEDGVAYAAAGLIDFDGTYVYALDAVTGELKWKNMKSGHLNEEARKGVSAQGYMTISDGMLLLAGGNTASPAMYDLETGECLNDAPETGAPESNRGQEIGLVGGKYVFVGGRAMYSAVRNVTNPANFNFSVLNGPGKLEPQGSFIKGRVAPAWTDDTFAFVEFHFGRLCYSDLDAIEDHFADIPEFEAKKARIWQEVSAMAGKEVKEAGEDITDEERKAILQRAFKVGGEKMREIQIEPDTHWRSGEVAKQDIISLALTGNAVITVNTNTDPNSPPRWTVAALGIEDGSVLWEQSLDRDPLPGGLLVDRDGRVVVVFEDGGVACFG